MSIFDLILEDMFSMRFADDRGDNKGIRLAPPRKLKVFYLKLLILFHFVLVHNLFLTLYPELKR